PWLTFWAQQLVQVKVERPELAAVVTGGDTEDAGAAGSADADAGRLLDGRKIDAVNDDLVDGPRPLGQGGCHEPAGRGAEGRVGARLELLVPAADLAAAAHPAARKRHDDPRHLPHGGHRRLRRGQRLGLAAADDQKVPARHAFGRTKDVLAGEL